MQAPLRLLSRWSCWCILLLACSLVQPSHQAVLPGGHNQHSDTTVSTSIRGGRTLQAPLSLYCNVTGHCGPCRSENLQSEACRLTGNAEKLACVTDSLAPHQVVLSLHRRINTAWQPLHISRGCQGPAGKSGATAGSSSSSTDGDAAITQHELDEPVAPAAAAAAPVQATASSSSSSSTASEEESAASRQHHPEPGSTVGEGLSVDTPPPSRQAYFAGSSRAGSGGLNVLYFELGMLLLLTGSLPVVYIRKKRYVRL